MPQGFVHDEVRKRARMTHPIWGVKHADLIIDVSPQHNDAVVYLTTI